MKSTRYSRQRETVLQVVLDDGGHLTADEIYKRVSKKTSQGEFGYRVPQSAPFGGG